jgi:hypothetical protein
MFRCKSEFRTPAVKYTGTYMSGKHKYTGTYTSGKHKYTGTYMSGKHKYKLQHTGPWPTAAWKPRRLCYRPAVFLRHLRITAPSFSHGKILYAFQKHYFIFFTLFNCVSLKLRKSGSVFTRISSSTVLTGNQIDQTSPFKYPRHNTFLILPRH